MPCWLCHSSQRGNISGGTFSLAGVGAVDSESQCTVGVLLGMNALIVRGNSPEVLVVTESVQFSFVIVLHQSKPYEWTVNMFFTVCCLHGCDAEVYLCSLSIPLAVNRSSCCLHHGVEHHNGLPD